MDVVVNGQHVEVDATLRVVTLEKIDRIAKFASDVRRVDVDYGLHQTRRAGDRCTCEILVHLKHHLVKGTASAVEHAMALDLALEKVQHQMRRLHERRIQRGRRVRSNRVRVDGVANPLGASDELVGAELSDADAYYDDADLDDAGLDAAGPIIVKTKQFAVKPMRAEEAALQMELLGHDFFLFRNVESNNAAALYRRRDGALGLIEVTG